MTLNPRIVATIEARMTSSRLPGKVLMKSLGKTMLEHMVSRVKRAHSLDDIVIATTINETDDVVIAEAQRLGVKYYRGSEENVMSRVLEAAHCHQADVIVELTGDCPLLDPALIDYAVAQYFASGADYISNLSLEEYQAGVSHPLGFAVQVFSTAVLADAYGRTDDPLDFEHVSRPLYQTPERYRVKYLPAKPAQQGPKMSVTLDTAEDFEVINAVLEGLSPHNPKFTIEDVVSFLSSHPEICHLNQSSVSVPKFSVLIIGCGAIAGGYDAQDMDGDNILTHAKAFNVHAGFDLVGCLDKDPKIAQDFAEKWNVDKAYTSLEAAMSDRHFDVVSICTSTASHADYLRKLWDYDVKLVFCEKPITDNLESARDIARLYPHDLAVNYIRRFDPKIRALATDIKNKKYGKFISGDAKYNKGLYNNGSHMTDVIQMFLGPLKIKAVLGKIYDYWPDDPTVSAILEEAGGGVINFVGRDVREGMIFDLTLLFEQGEIILTDFSHRVIIRPKGKPACQIETDLPRAMLQAVSNIYRHMTQGEPLYSTSENAILALETCDKIKHLGNLS